MFTPAPQLTHENAREQLEAGLAAVAAGQNVISLQQTGTIDSSAVACLLAWQRQAQQRGARLELTHLPANLTHLIQLYGVAELL